MSPEGSTRTGILPDCPSLDRRSREAAVELELRTSQSVNSRKQIYLHTTWAVSWSHRPYTHGNPTQYTRFYGPFTAIKKERTRVFKVPRLKSSYIGESLEANSPMYSRLQSDQPECGVLAYAHPRGGCVGNHGPNTSQHKAALITHQQFGPSATTIWTADRAKGKPCCQCITNIHVSRYLEYRSNWNMRQPSAAHSFAGKHHKQEIQLGSR
ncbi:hypothetical protein T265_00085 [Opisthorchis viverrini]|uniref:Uncharacterized protein n=1 Tax=Opisthorchis viverrini TaxID=6198 RepID=A0A075A795_OPIVI|nr:hypothetical protein T265_00085 [Opisthorchis viverrini]KER34227.1 hypothetical protein T265_00085 [Opisthorchis viverrini]